MISPWMVGRIGDHRRRRLVLPQRQRRRPGRLRRRAASTTSRACCPATSPPGTAGTATSSGGSFYNMVRARRRRASTSRCSTSSTRATRSPRPPRRAACVPAGSGIRALDEDGTPCSSDYYLRLTADGGRMLKGQIALTAVPAHPAGRRHHAAAHRRRPGRRPAHHGQQPATAGSRPRTRWTATPAATGRAPTTRSRSGSRSTWAPRSAVSQLVLRLPSGWGARTQTLTVQGSTDGSSFSTASPSAGRTFNPAADQHPDRRVHRPLRPPHRHRQHRLAGRPAQRIRGVRRRRSGRTAGGF